MGALNDLLCPEIYKERSRLPAGAKPKPFVVFKGTTLSPRNTGFTKEVLCYLCKQVCLISGFLLCWGYCRAWCALGTCLLCCEGAAQLGTIFLTSVKHASFLCGINKELQHSLFSSTSERCLSHRRNQVVAQFSQEMNSSRFITYCWK